MNIKLNTFLRIALILAVFGVPTVASAQATGTGDVNAEVQEIPISLTQDDPLSFGIFMPFGRAGLVTVGAEATFLATDVHVVVDGQRALWTVAGVPDAYFGLSIPSDTATITNAAGDSMSVINLHTDTVDGILNQNGPGQEQFALGGTLEVQPNQPPGFYSGTYVLTVAYN